MLTLSLRSAPNAGRRRTGGALMAALLAALVALAAPGCREQKAAASSTGEDAGATVSAAPEVVLDLTPALGEGAVEIKVRATGTPTASVNALRIARAWADTRATDVIRDIEVHDATGPIDAGPPRELGPDVIYPLARAPKGGEFSLRYRASGADRAGSRLALRTGGGRVSGVGHSFLLLPSINTPVPVTIRWHLGVLGKGAEGASSFGAGEEVRAVATMEELAHAVYIAGPLTKAEDGEGRRMIMLGEPELDVGAVLDWTLRAEGHARRLFRDEPQPDATSTRPRVEPFSFLMIAEPGMGGSHDGVHLTRSLGLWFDASRALDGRLRIAIAHELLHRWLGAALRLDDEEGGRDAAWFSEGFTVHYARLLLFREELITPADFVADLRRTLAPAPPFEPERRGHGGASARSEGYRRGALYAAYLDAALRKRSRGARSLDDLLVELLGTARGLKKARLPVSAFRELVVRDLGPKGGDDFDRLIARAEEPVVPPSNAFGPCFRRASSKEPVFELGFDAESLRGVPALIRGLKRASAAARAGLREGALVLEAKLPGPDATVETSEVRLTLADGAGGKRIAYKPVAERYVLRWDPQPCKR